MWCQFDIDTTIIPPQIHPKELLHNILYYHQKIQLLSDHFKNKISIAKINGTLSFCTMTHYSETRHIYLPIKETYSFFLAAILNLLLVFMRGLKSLIMLSESKIMCTYSLPLESDDTYQFFDAFM